MSLYTYAIINSNSKISDSINGLEGRGVYNIPYRDMGVVVSETEQIYPVRNGVPQCGISNGVQNITKEHILKHEEVVEKLMESFTVLPVSFLTQFSQEDDVLLMMKEYHSDFKQNLERLRNKVEFGLKVIWPADTIRGRIVAAYSNKNKFDNFTLENPQLNSFVKDKFQKHIIEKEFQEEANRCITIVDDYFNKVACEKKLKKLQTENLLLNASYLVEKDRQNEFKRAFEQLKSPPGDLRFLFSGPWPCYNFINLNKKPSSDILNRLSAQQDLSERSVV